MAHEESLSAGGGAPVPTTVLDLTAPHGLEQILAMFGDIYEYIGNDGSLNPKWQADVLTRVTLPFPLKLSWDLTTSVQQITCHKRFADLFVEVFETAASRGLQWRIDTFGGCFSFRPQRASSKLSTHAWGIAIDLNPASNAQGTRGDMDDGVVALFRELGFLWGGDWAGMRRDAMHFQFCSGY